MSTKEILLTNFTFGSLLVSKMLTRYVFLLVTRMLKSAPMVLTNEVDEADDGPFCNVVSWSCCKVFPVYACVF